MTAPTPINASDFRALHEGEGVVTITCEEGVVVEDLGDRAIVDFAGEQDIVFKDELQGCEAIDR